MKQRFDVTGMSCTACSSYVERAVSALAGVSSVTVDLMQNRMLVEYDDSKLSEAEVCQAGAAALTEPLTFPLPPPRWKKP